MFTNSHLLCARLCFVYVEADGTLQIQQVIVPTQVMSGSNVVLRCLYKDIPDDDTSSFSSSSPSVVGETTMSPATHAAATTLSSLATSPLYSLKW